MCQAEDVLVSCYYLNKKLEFFGIPLAQVSDVQIAVMVSSFWSGYHDRNLVFLFRTSLCCAYISVAGSYL